MSLKIERLNSVFEKEISVILQMEVKDPLVRLVTVTGCEITNDLSYAKVYFTVLPDDKKEECMKALERSKSFIRGQLSRRVEVRHTPELRFVFDSSLEYGKRIESIIEEINDEQK